MQSQINWKIEIWFWPLGMVKFLSIILNLLKIRNFEDHICFDSNIRTNLTYKPNVGNQNCISPFLKNGEKSDAALLMAILPNTIF